MVEFYPEPPEPPEAWDPSSAQLAFAAYADAWAVREQSGDTSEAPLVAALRTRRVPKEDWAEGTDLRDTVFGAWHDGRSPRRLHGVILRYRARRIRAFPREIRELFRDTTPEHLRVPTDLAKASSWADGSDDETELPFRPVGSLASRLPGWYDALEGEKRWREVPVWLDPADSATRTVVMVGRDVIGHTTVPVWAHDVLRVARRRSKRVVADGELTIRRRKDGTFKIHELLVTLPEPPD